MQSKPLVEIYPQFAGFTFALKWGAAQPAFTEVLARAALDRHPGRHLVLQELIHGKRMYPDDKGDRSHVEEMYLDGTMVVSHGELARKDE